MIYICIIKTEATDACTNSQTEWIKKNEYWFYFINTLKF